MMRVGWAEVRALEPTLAALDSLDRTPASAV
jgi:hypothetical protein